MDLNELYMRDFEFLLQVEWREKFRNLEENILLFSINRVVCLSKLIRSCNSCLTSFQFKLFCVPSSKKQIFLIHIVIQESCSLLIQADPLLFFFSSFFLIFNLLPPTPGTQYRPPPPLKKCIESHD